MKETHFIGQNQKEIGKIEFIYEPSFNSRVRIGTNVYTIRNIVDEFTDNPAAQIRYVFTELFSELEKQIL